MNCPTCGERTTVIRVHDENPFEFRECVSCGWDDYEERYKEMVVDARHHDDDGVPLLDFNNDEVDEDELDETC